MKNRGLSLISVLLIAGCATSLPEIQKEKLPPTPAEFKENWAVATPAAAHSALGGAPGKAMTLSGNGTSRTTRSIWRASDRRGTKKPLAPASANALPRWITSSISASP